MKSVVERKSGILKHEERRVSGGVSNTRFL